MSDLPRLEALYVRPAAAEGQPLFPALAAAYRALRAALGMSGPPLNVIVSTSGALDLTLPVFQSGAVAALIVSTAAGAQRLTQQSLPAHASLAAATNGEIMASAVLDAIAQTCDARIILVEGGPHLMGNFLAERRLNELFLTLAPQVAGRDGTDGATARLGFVAGKVFAPDTPRWGTLESVHRGGDYLFLRYAFGSGEGAQGNPDTR